MKLCDLLSVDELDADVARGMIRMQRHPSDPLRIYNYTAQATFSDEPWTLAMTVCRGLIVNDQDEVVARPFPKFWNLGDARHPETLAENLPSEDPLIQEKMDGSLGIRYLGADGPAIATRGSFTSDQAQFATQLYRSRHLQDEAILSAMGSVTALFEIIFPANRVVVDYGSTEALVLLALIDNESGEEVPMPEGLSFQRPEVFPLSVHKATMHDKPNFEGFVATWLRAGIPPLKVKIKLGEYRRLHRLYCSTSPRSVWEALAAGQPIGAAGAGSAFEDWLKDCEENIRGNYLDVLGQAMSAYAFRPVCGRKGFAEYAKKYGAPVRASLFAMLDGKRPDPIIWKAVRPRAEKAFRRNDEDNA